MNSIERPNNLNLSSRRLKDLSDIKPGETKRKFENIRNSIKLMKENNDTKIESISSPENDPVITPIEKKVVVRQESICSLEPNQLLLCNENFEIFDPSLKFVAIHRCYYWSKNDRIRKGKIFLTASELIFKCSGMPFVKLRLHFSDISDVVRIKNFKHKLETVLSIETKFESSYVFYKFRMPKKVIKTSLLQLIEEFNKSVENEDPAHTHLLRLRKLGQPISNFKHAIKTSINNRHSMENLDEENILPQNDTVKPESKFRTLRRIKLRSKSQDLTNNQDQESGRRTRFIKNQISKVFMRRSFEQVSHDEDDKPDLSSSASILETSTTDDTSDSKSISTNDDISEETESSYSLNGEIETEISDVQFVQKPQEIIIDTKSSTLVILFITFLAIIIFLVLAINNFMKISLIEKKILELF
ncbi:unnamed protein product [Brachionus calyciflorus]|uniref:GRAM domain-containing protein n=1 Tax=Brachionus calyciflorus TaxID=104777 RepID=A0A814E687_9BILA|nr:unnamed protein product [Brachionus calyciflorus]